MMSVVFFSGGLIRGFCSVTMTDWRDATASLMNEDVVVNRAAEVIDLKTYRERKAEQATLAEAADVFAHNFHYGQAPLSPFAMPVAFFVFWPTWIFTPRFASDSNRGGNGAA